MKTIAICNQKGGVGKSTTTFHLTRTAILAGSRVLMVDCDPQGNLTSASPQSYWLRTQSALQTRFLPAPRKTCPRSSPTPSGKEQTWYLQLGTL